MKLFLICIIIYANRHLYIHIYRYIICIYICRHTQSGPYVQTKNHFQYITLKHYIMFIILNVSCIGAHPNYLYRAYVPISMLFTLFNSLVYMESVCMQKNDLLQK